jgi:PqqA peptide cyclase
MFDKGGPVARQSGRTRSRCRCQAFALTGDARATDPVCHLSPRHQEVAALAAVQRDEAYDYRRM